MGRDHVTIGAIQAELPYPPERYDFLSPNYCGDIEEVLEHFVKPRILKVASLLRKAGEEGCDIVTTSEDVTGTAIFLTDIGENSRFKELVTRSAALCDEALSAVAREYRMYVIGCYHHPEGDALYNRASLFDRSGALCGWYDKVQLPFHEKWLITPGSRLPVFSLDFGTIGITICYEMMFPEIMGTLALSGAEIVFHPTAGYGWYDSIGEATLRTRANDGDLYLVTAKSYAGNGAGKSSVIDDWGQVLADAGFYPDVVVCKTIDLTKKKRQPDWFVPSRMSGTPFMRERRAMERRPSLYGLLADESLTVTKEFSKEEQQAIRNDLKSGKAHW